MGPDRASNDELAAYYNDGLIEDDDRCKADLLKGYSTKLLRSPRLLKANSTGAKHPAIHTWLHRV